MSFLNPVFSTESATYRDGKRYAWITSLVVPALLGCGPLFYWLTGSMAALWIPVLLVYTAIPLLDVILGEDLNNPPEEVVPLLEADPYYRWATYALVPVLWAAFLSNAWFVGTHELPWYGVLAMAVNSGLICGFGINLGHELGHKKSKLERNLATSVLAMGAYGHFAIDHNRGHHRHVATPEDCASSRMGENLYAFALRELPGAFRRAWRLERGRLERHERPVWSLENEIVRAGLITATASIVLTLLLGAVMIPYLLLAYFIGAFHLTMANYIEHYGLLRQKRANGLYERCEPHHSWNSNHICSNWALYHLQRHSDHHANPGRRYQSLRHFEDLPTLPNGYFGMFLVALVPTLWFRIMDPLLVTHVDGDPRRIHFDPKRRGVLCARYRLATDGESTATQADAVAA
ncbi:MAG: alkane 1-monooxygenase [Myxococcales bacterium SG8_38]|nr:MAG: alkane 1-monooxygenase [Myxococcales bacterium SG8_38]